MTLRDKLIVLRDKAGISQMTLAEQLGVSRQAISRWESGDAVPTMDKLKSLSKIYNVSLSVTLYAPNYIFLPLQCKPHALYIGGNCQLLYFFTLISEKIRDYRGKGYNPIVLDSQFNAFYTHP